MKKESFPARTRRGFLRGAVLCGMASTTLVGAAQVSVLTYKYDSARKGANVNETVLTPANVSGPMFQRIFTAPVDGVVYAQPLYVAGLGDVAGGVQGQKYDVLFVATERDSVYAFDADSNHPTGLTLWNRSYLSVGETPVASIADLHCADLTPEVGITSTPVIDAATETLYMVTKTKGKGIYHQRLHAISLKDGSEKFGGPVEIAAMAPGTNLAFDPRLQLNRAGLLLADTDEGKNVIVTFAGHCDQAPYHGWVMAYDAASLRQKFVFNTSPNGEDAGIWMSGDGVAADERGRLYFATGNGTYDGAAKQDFGDSIIRLDPKDGTYVVGDWFAPWDQVKLGGPADADLGAGGLLLLPDVPKGVHHHLLVQTGKDGEMHILDRDNMGKFCTSCGTRDTQIVQEIQHAMAGMWGTPAYWNGFLYWSSGRAPDFFKEWTFDIQGQGGVSLSPSSQTVQKFGFSAASPVVSANGNSNGIVWLLDNSGFNWGISVPAGPQVLLAYDATNLAKMLFSSAKAGAHRDQAGPSVKFTSPIIANGRVFAGAVNSVSAWGLVTTPALSRILSNSIAPSVQSKPAATRKSSAKITQTKSPQ